MYVKCVIHFRCPQHEEEVGELAREIGFTHLSLSSAIMPMARIVPRGFTGQFLWNYHTPVFEQIESFLLSSCDSVVKVMDDSHLDGCRFSPGWSWILTWVAVDFHMGCCGFSPGWPYLGGSRFSPGWPWILAWVAMDFHLGGRRFSPGWTLILTSVVVILTGDVHEPKKFGLQIPVLFEAWLA